MATIRAALPVPASAGGQSKAATSKWEDSDSDSDAAAPSAPAPPVYGRRIGWAPKSIQDYGKGGAYPELINIKQYPLDMARPGAAASKSNALSLTTDSQGRADYDVILGAGVGGRIVHSKLSDYREKDVDGETFAPRPSEEEKREAAERTGNALGQLVEKKLKAYAPRLDKSGRPGDASFVRYTPQSTDAAKSENGAATRIIKMVSAPVDPLEPPKFGHKKIPRGAPSPPPPVLHSPPKKVTAEEQKAWVIPPCISNWKNAKGYTIPLDKRLAADGRGVQKVTINDNFARLSEALFVADRHARENVKIRNEMAQKLVEKEKRDKEEQLRLLAQRARDQRSGVSRDNEGGAPRAGDDDDDSSSSSSSSDSDSSDSDSSSSDSDDNGDKHDSAEKRDAIRRERAKARAREVRKQADGGSSRHVSEKIDLKKAQPTATHRSGETLFDERLFNQTAGISSGFGAEDGYSIYDKKLFTGSSDSVYRPKKSGGDAGEVYERMVASRAAHQGFSGTDGGGGGGGDGGPVKFEKQKEDDFEALLGGAPPASRKREAMHEQRGTMHAAGAGRREDYSSHDGRRIDFQEEKRSRRD
ncbi:MAG: hypothetical protein SGCHY_001889 [Lobulomycetales sp.]